jgi:hypothetical protein
MFWQCVILVEFPLERDITLIKSVWIEVRPTARLTDVVQVEQSRGRSFFFFSACILRYYLSKPLTSLSCPWNAVFPGLKMWDTFAFDCSQLEGRPGTRGLNNNPGQQRQSNLKSPQTTCYCNFFIQLYSATLATWPRTQGYRKMRLFHTKRRSGRDRESNPGHLIGRQSL